jgi:chemotaxis protein MotB
MTYSLKSGAILLPLLVPAFLSGCVSKSDYEALQAQNQQLQAQNQQLQQQVASHAEHIERLRGAVAYSVNSDLLFRSGSWELSDEGKSTLAGVAHRLAAGQTVPLVVNGYTDDAPIGAALKRKGVETNDALSQKRAESVMQAMIDGGVKPDMVSAQGHGESNPVADNKTKEGRAANRRVEITYGSSGAAAPS